MKSYAFHWSHLGSPEQGRPHLGAQAPVLVYRLMQFTLKDVLCRELGSEKTAQMLAQAGELAGREFCRHELDTSLAPAVFLAELEKKLIDLKIGILRIEAADMASSRFTLTVSEDLECSGLPVLGETACEYDEGFIAGVLGEFTGKDLSVREIDCWALGDRTCRFDIRPREE